MKGFMRNIEVVLAILLVLTTFSFFTKWDQFREQVFTADRSAYELLRAQGPNMKLALFEPSELDSLVKQSMPSNLNYRMELEYASPFDYRSYANDSRAIYSAPYEFPPGTDYESVSLTDSRGFPMAVELRSNWYRQPFLIDTSDGPVSGDEISASFSLPFVDSNSDGLAERPAPDSLHLYVDDKPADFAIGKFVDSGDASLVTINFNATIPRGRLVKSYLYYQVGEWDEG